jgi:uncharacterized protein
MLQLHRALALGFAKLPYDGRSKRIESCRFVTSTDPSLEPLTRTQVLLALGATALVLLGGAKLWQHLGQVPILPLVWNQSQFLGAIALTLALVTLSALLYSRWTFYRDCSNRYLTLVLSPLHWPDLVWIGLLPGLSEELLFRGVMLPALGLNGLGIWVSGLCFGVLHLNGREQWLYAVVASGMGLLLGWIAVETHNLLIPIVVHILVNLLSAGLWKWRQTNG